MEGGIDRRIHKIPPWILSKLFEKFSSQIIYFFINPFKMHADILWFLFSWREFQKPIEKEMSIKKENKKQVKPSLMSAFIFRFITQWILGNLGKMAPSTIQKLRATITGKDNQDDSLITEVYNSLYCYCIIDIFFSRPFCVFFPWQI